MARNLGPKCKKCRRLGESVCGSAKCAVIRRNYVPGQHGPRLRPRHTEYGLQLREKQKVRALYGVLERQFRNYYKKADKTAGNTGQILKSLLEQRLDNAVYRAGYATTRSQARQLVTHGHFLVNGRRCDIPSLQTQTGDVITLREKSQKSPYFENNAAETQMHEAPNWLQIDRTKHEIKIQSEPTSDDFEQNVAINLIVEFYSR